MSKLEAEDIPLICGMALCAGIMLRGFFDVGLWLSHHITVIVN